MSHHRTPTTIVTGFLGSGKTTIIRHLVDELQAQGVQVVYIKNELGDATVDSQILKTANVHATELLNGCICCTLVGPFNTAIDEAIATYRPDRVIIESAGTADPASLALMVAHHPRLYRDGQLAVIDVVNFDGYADISLIAQRQAEFTDLIIFNKVELVDTKRKQAVVGYVRELSPLAPIVEAPLGRISPELAFGLSPTFSEAELAAGSDSDLDSSALHHHTQDDHITSFTFRTSKKFNKDKVVEAIAALPRESFRVKGVVQLIDGQWLILNAVFKRVDWFPLSSESPPPSESVIICIGYEVERHEKTISAVLENAAE